MNKFLCALVATLCGVVATAQIVWNDPMQAGYPVVQNQAFVGEIEGYVRLPKRAEGMVRKDVWNLAQQSAGLAISFYTNSANIEVRYTTTSSSYAMPHMPATGKSGVDLYRVGSGGEWSFCFGSYSFGEQVVYKYNSMVDNDGFHRRGFEYRLFLPLYNGVKHLEIGVDEGAKFSFIPVSNERPIVLYGTSIAQGGCATRPSMAWGSILQRSLDCPLVNLGFSGNGRLEREVLDFVIEIDASLYILDCIPNLTNYDDVEQRMINAVKQIRAKHAEPILIIEHVGYSNEKTNARHRESVAKANADTRKAYEKLIAEGVEELYYISKSELGCQPNMMVDYVHLTDLGMTQQATVVERKVREILKMEVGERITQQPVTQRREPGSYEWLARHRSIVEQVKKGDKRSIIFGNSIVHYWGGAHRTENGRQVWADRMQSFVNAGCGWDRIENLLWRVYHGELDGVEIDRIILMIGTNNLDRDSDEDIVEGIRFLLSAIRERQPKAEIKLVGLLPRRDKEQRVKLLNKQLRSMAAREGCDYVDAGKSLLLKNGKVDESLFYDGLHPNNDGYARIVDAVIE